MKKLLLPLALIGYSLLSMNNDYPGRHSGTTLLVYADKDSIIIGADSRTIEPTSMQMSDTGKKIFNFGSTFFAFAGVDALMTNKVTNYRISFIPLIKAVFDPTKSIQENSEAIREIISDQFQGFLKLAPSRLRDSLIKGGGWKYINFNLYIVTYIGMEPYVSSIDIHLNSVKNKLALVSPDPIISNGTGKLFSVGLSDSIQNESNIQALKSSENKIEYFGKLVAIEARHHTEVDSNLYYAVLKPNSYKYGKRYH